MDQFLLRSHIGEPRVGGDRNADVLCVCGVHQLLFSGKRDVACHTIAQQRLARDRPV